jgi:hypothetical protein
VRGRTAVALNVIDRGAEICTITSGEHHARAPARRQLRGHQADSLEAPVMTIVRSVSG